MFRILRPKSVLSACGLLFGALIPSDFGPTEGTASAAEQSPTPLPSPSSSTEAAGVRVTRPSSAASSKARTGESQQGSRALNRFDADPVIYSTYEQDGKPLEVDPD